MAILISEKVQFRERKLPEAESDIIEWQKGQATKKTQQSSTFFPKQWLCKLHEVKIDKMERKTRQTHNYSWRHQPPSLNNLENNYIEHQQRPIRTKSHHQPTGSNRHFQNTPPHASKILFKYPWDMYRDRPYPGQKSNLNKCKRTEIIQSVFSDYSGFKLEIKEKDNRQPPNT